MPTAKLASQRDKSQTERTKSAGGWVGTTNCCEKEQGLGATLRRAARPRSGLDRSNHLQ